jgi:hypothetical protein
MRCPSCCSYDVMESSIVLLCKRVALVFIDIIYIIIYFIRDI